MKVAAREDGDLAALLVKEEEGIVGGRIELDGQLPGGLDDGVADGTVDLGNAAQSVGILNVARIVAA